MAHSDLTDLQTQINYHFKDSELLRTALTHRSLLNDPQYTQSYERLEFLGDAILEMLITSYLYETYPDKDEGYLTSARSAVVKTESLSQIGRKMDLGTYILMSKGEESTGGRNNNSTLEDVIESLIGALYIDGGIEVASTFFDQFILPEASVIIQEDRLKDSKSLLQERVQAMKLASPVYQVIQEIGPDHDKTFEIQVFINDQPIASGMGKSKQEAEQRSAEKALLLI
jgi:ribonuclease III